MVEYPQVEDDDLRRLTDGELFSYPQPATAKCSCGARFIEMGYLAELLTELGETCVSEQKQDAYRGLRTLVKEWRHGRA